MRDLGVLKERIEYAERHLKSAHSARERESDALLKMWEQIRGRFDAQEKDIARFRDEVTELSRVNDELSALVDKLASIVEGSIEDSGNETVPEVTRLADDLLQSEPAAGRIAPPAPRPPRAAPAQSLDDLETDDPLELGTPLDEMDDDEDLSFGALLGRTMESDAAKPAAADAAHDDFEDEDDLDIPERVSDDSASVGIRDLIARIEGSVRPEATQEDDAEEDDDLARELREIEQLRDQLSSLHSKVSDK
jgi:uncharacterized coiled-coil protein SlyX